MSSPADEISEPAYLRNNSATNPGDRSSDEDGTVVGEQATSEQHVRNETSRERDRPSVNHLNVNISNLQIPTEGGSSLRSPSQSREEAHRLDDELKMLQIERQVSTQVESERRDPSTARSARRERSRREDVVDDFDVATNPLHERAQIYKPPENPAGATSRFFKRVHNSNILIRHFTYITPPAIIIAIPLTLGLVFGNANNVGGVQLGWFCVWLEICWLTLWAGRLIAKILPYPIGLIASLFTNNSKKWRDMGKQLELAATLFFWWLGIEVSFLPTMRSHDVDPTRTEPRPWQGTMNKVLVSFFVGAILNFVEKIIIQLIAISFHLRTYQDRIEINKFQIGSLTKLYEYSKHILEMDDSEFEEPGSGGGATADRPGSGARTPGMIIEKAQKNTKKAFLRFGDVTGKIAGDFTGRKVVQSNHPSQVVISLLSSPTSSQVLARRLYRTFARPETELIHQEDLKNAFETDDEADAAFSMFDKDLNGDINMEELEAVCVEIGRERKSITASLKDLDSVVSKLDNVFTFVVVVVVILVLISLLSTSAAGVLTSAGSTILALSWLFSTTAQEFLQSVIFVFVKHPFDVGDRVTIYGNTGKELTGDDYFVKEIALLYTEFKKMEGHVVQAPNSYLNELFILNQRRSGGLAEGIPMIFKFGTTVQQIESLREKLLDFVKAEKREYQGNILTELKEITEAHSITLNVVFFYKSNWQNELVRLKRRNKFICALMEAMQECGIEGPRARYPGQKETFPLYMQQMPFDPMRAGLGGTPDNPSGTTREPTREEHLPSIAEDEQESNHQYNRDRSASNFSSMRRRGESLSQMGRRVDWSLGMNNVTADIDIGNVEADQNEILYKRIEKINKQEQERKSQSRGRASSSSEQEKAFTTARQGTFNLHRSRTDIGGRTSLNRERGSLMSVHRNRFFGRQSLDRDPEGGMAGIREGSNEAPQLPNPLRMDPRSGTVSQNAVRRSSDVSRSAFPRLSMDNRSPRPPQGPQSEGKPEMKQI